MSKAPIVKPYHPRKVWDTFAGLDNLHFHQGLYPAEDLYPRLFLTPGDPLGTPHYPQVYPGINPGIQNPWGALWHETLNEWYLTGGAARINVDLDNRVAVTPAFISNVWIRIRIRLGLANSRGGICFRAWDEDNYWFAVLDDANQQVRLYDRQAGVETLRANPAFVIDEATWYVLAVLACDEDIRVFVDEVQVLAFDGEFQKYEFNHGMFLEAIDSRIDWIIIEKAPPAYPR